MHVHVTLVKLPQMFGYGRPERGRSHVCDFRGEPQQPSGEQVPIGLGLPELVRGRRKAVLLHGALQEVHLPVLEVRRSYQLVRVHRQIGHVCNPVEMYYKTRISATVDK